MLINIEVLVKNKYDDKYSIIEYNSRNFLVGETVKLRFNFLKTRLFIKIDIATLFSNN